MKRVKTLVAVALVALVTAFSANARITFGPKVGLNVDHLSGNWGADFKDACGVTAGVTAEFVVPIIGVGADLSLMYTHMTADVEHGEKVMQNMLEIPLHLKYKVNIPVINNIIRPYVFTGPVCALRLGGNYDDLDWKKGQWGWDLGIGVELIRHLQIGAGYTFGINDAVKYVAPVTKDEFKIKNNYWTVTAAWLF